MTAATTAAFQDIVIELELVASSGTYTAVCGMKQATINRQANVETDEVPDCDDLSVPFDEVSEVRSVNVSISGTGVYAKENHKTLVEAFYAGTAKLGRIRYVGAATGELETESGSILITQMTNESRKGGKWSADFTFQFNATPTLANAS